MSDPTDWISVGTLVEICDKNGYAGSFVGLRCIVLNAEYNANGALPHLQPVVDRPDLTISRRLPFYWDAHDLRPATPQVGDIVEITGYPKDSDPHRSPLFIEFKAEVAETGTHRYGSKPLLRPLSERPDGQGLDTFYWTAEHLRVLSPAEREELSNVTATTENVCAEPALTIADLSLGKRVRFISKDSGRGGVQIGSLGTVTRVYTEGGPVGLIKFDDYDSGGSYSDSGQYYITPNTVDHFELVTDDDKPAEPTAVADVPTPAVTFTAEEVHGQLWQARRAAEARADEKIEELKRSIGRVAGAAAREHGWCDAVKEALQDAGIDPDVYFDEGMIEFEITRTYKVRARRNDGRNGVPSESWILGSICNRDTNNELEFDDDLEDVEIVDVADKVGYVEASDTY